MKDKLITKNYIEILAANFLLFFGFWLLMPVLPFYLAEVFDANKTTIGAVLSCYTIAALCIRPFSGYPVLFHNRYPTGTGGFVRLSSQQGNRSSAHQK